jgi:ligand-binding sensor domain-containing protein
VWTSADGGATWRQLDGNGPRRLPNLPVHSIVADPGDPQRLFVGTDLGVFTSTAGGIRWAVENTGFANALTETLQIQSAGGTTWLFAFTHGRGAWRVELSP